MVPPYHRSIHICYHNYCTYCIFYLRLYISNIIFKILGGRDPYPEELNQNLFTGHIKSLLINQFHVEIHSLRVHDNISVDS